MRKFLSPVVTQLKSFLAVIVFLLVANQSNAQCGLSSFAGPGSPYSPNTGFQNTIALGSGEYDDFNVVSGNIYSFDLTSTTAPVTNYLWDLTVSSTSAIINYNNSLTPLPNSWNNGIGCPQTSRPASAEWFATYTGTVRVNVKSWDAVNGCHDFVPGQGSAVLKYKECVPTADPGSGFNNWNVDVFATTDINIPPGIINARYGTYVDNASGTNFVTTNYWAQASNPSTASGWTGCQMPNNNFVLRARRTSFPCSGYSIVVNKAVNNIAIFLNGNQIYTGTNINSPVTVGQWALTNTDNVEIRMVDICGAAGGVANVSITPLSPPAVVGGTIGGVANNSNVCPGVPLGNFTNVTSGSGGVSTYNNSLPITYRWELSTNGGLSFSPVAGVTTSSWNSSTTVPAGATYVIKRIATDQCGNENPSNTITVFGRPAPNGSINPSTQTICSGGTATLTFNFSPGTAPFNISYTNSINSYSLTNVANGATAPASPPYTVTYNFTSITDAYGCTTTSGFTAGASVVVTNPININNVAVTGVACNGSGNGSIIISASGGLQPLMYSIDGGNNYQVSNSFSNLTVGNYNIIVKDSLGCSHTYGSNPIVIGQPTPITESLSSVNASCTGVYNGSITVTASGGTPPYTYSVNGGPTQASNVINGLQSGGPYLITTYDSHGCSDTASITIGSTYVVTLDTLSTSDITCYGQGNGTVSVQLVGGTPPLQYSINGTTYQNSGNFTGLSAGSFTVIGRDSRGCSQSANVNITTPTQLVVAIDSITNASCGGTGSIYTIVTGGTPGYSYQWSNSGVVTPNDLNVPAGTYNVVVTDSRNCTASNGATIVAAPVLSLNIALFTNPFCNNDSTGAILLTANGGVPPYAYSWSNGSTTQDIDSLRSGTYTATVTDVNSCAQTISQTLINPLPLTSSTSSSDVTCAGNNNGTAGVIAGGGVGPYTYLWSDFQVTPSISGLAGGVYYVFITDHNHCQLKDSVRVVEPAPLVIVDTVINISCFNLNDGAINISVAGGTLPYTFAWSNGATTQNVSNLSGGMISGTVTDANHCFASVSANIINPSQINPIFGVNNVACFGDTSGSINLNIIGGTPGYSYVWSNGFTTTPLTNLVPGTYYVTITDSRNCTLIDSATVTSPGALYTSGILKNVSCYGLCDGYIYTRPYGGTLPYSFQWSNGPSTEDVIQLCGGSYYLTVTDAHNCKVASLYIIHEPPLLTETITANNNLCYGVCNGSLASTPVGGTPPYQYLWNNFSTDSMATGLCAGHYTLLLTDSNGCHISDTADLTQPAPFIVTGNITNIACSGFNTGAVNLSISGGTSPYTFAWSNLATTQNISTLTAGPYSVTVTDAHGCTQVGSYYVGQSQGIHTNVSLYQPRCAGGNDGFISVAVTGGISPYRYSWSTTPTQIGATATNLVAGTYTLTITDSISCSATVSANLQDPTPLTVTTPGFNSRCYNNPNGVVIALASGGLPPYNYTLNGVFQTSDTFTALPPAHYVVLVQDANGCQGTASFNIGVASSISVSLSVADQRILTGMQTQLSAAAVSDTTITHYFWSPIAIDSVDVFNYGSCSDTTDCPAPYVSPPFTQTFMVRVENIDSCFATDTITVYVDNEPGSFLPTAFTPNNDGLNDRFAVTFLGASKIEITIYNRWGEKLYYNANQTNNLNAADGWDGTANGKPAPEDTYVYQINVTYFNGVVKNKAGTVTLAR